MDYEDYFPVEILIVSEEIVNVYEEIEDDIGRNWKQIKELKKKSGTTLKKKATNSNQKDTTK